MRWPVNLQMLHTLILRCMQTWHPLERPICRPMFKRSGSKYNDGCGCNMGCLGASAAGTACSLVCKYESWRIPNAVSRSFTCVFQSMKYWVSYEGGSDNLQHFSAIHAEDSIPFPFLLGRLYPIVLLISKVFGDNQHTKLYGKKSRHVHPGYRQKWRKLRPGERDPGRENCPTLISADPQPRRGHVILIDFGPFSQTGLF